jgi:hypothetical protein
MTMHPSVEGVFPVQQDAIAVNQNYIIHDISYCLHFTIHYSVTVVNP